MIRAYVKWFLTSALCVAFAGSCGGASTTTHGSESHFLDVCGPGDCPSGLECVCGVCTRVCEGASQCDALSRVARCVELDDLPAGVSCDDVSLAQGVCDAPCTSDPECHELGAGFSCSEGVCRKVPVVVPACEQPQVVGPCLAAMPRYWHNPETDVCEAFVYGGCGGNANNFGSLEECLAACDVAPGLGACQLSSDCKLVENQCCLCEPFSSSAFLAVNVSYTGDVAPGARCDLVDCRECPAVPQSEMTRGHFAARCEAGQCVVFDVRESEYSDCGGGQSCVLRSGFGCCERCDGSLLTSVASNVNVAAALNCPEPACPPCVPTYPEEASAACVAGRCSVLWSN